MARNNDVFQVLVAKGNQAVLAAAKKITEILPGQVGVFDADTNLSVSTLANTKNFYVAVGLDKNGDSITDDIAKSSGNFIQKQNIGGYTYQAYTAPQPMKVLLKDYTADCETEYGIKLELRNQKIYRSQGYNQFTKTYSIVTSCCNGCEPTCPSGDANEITKQLKFNINIDELGLVTAIAVARQDLTTATHGVSADLSTGDEVSDADLEAIMAFNATQTDPANFVYTDLVIETVSQALASFGSLNLQYFYPRQTAVIASKIEGFKCNGEVETIQDMVFEEGSGYDVKQLEFVAKGWTESPYRLSALTGTAKDTEYNTDLSSKYNTFVLTYQEESRAAWLQYKHDLSTIIEIPTTSTTTLAGLVAILNTAGAGTITV